MNVFSHVTRSCFSRLYWNSKEVNDMCNDEFMDYIGFITGGTGELPSEDGEREDDDDDD